MNLKIKGTIANAAPEISGISKSGNQWRKREYVIHTPGPSRTTPVAFSVMNDNIDKLNLIQGQEYEIDINIESREYNGRWYTSITAWGATPVAATSPQPATPPPAPAADPSDEFPF